MLIWFSRKDPKNYFEILGYPKAIIRINFHNKTLFYSILALVILGILSIIVLHSVITGFAEKWKTHFEQLDDYKTELDKFEKMNDYELILYNKKKI